MTITSLRTQKLSHARRIARSLGTTENSLDTSILAQTGLVTAIIEGRSNTGVALQVGHSAFKKAIAALDAMAEARDLIVGCHADLADIRDQFHLRADDIGCTPDKGVRTGPQGLAA